jgi:hypothetical protein
MTNGAWWLVSAAIPIAIGLARFIWNCFGETQEVEDVPHDPEWVDHLTKIENVTYTNIHGFLLYVTTAGLVFLHVASICNWPRPRASWIGLYVWVPIVILAMYVPVVAVVHFILKNNDWMETISCLCPCCWRQRVQISPDVPV